MSEMAADLVSNVSYHGDEWYDAKCLSVLELMVKRLTFAHIWGGLTFFSGIPRCEVFSVQFSGSTKREEAQRGRRNEHMNIQLSSIKLRFARKAPHCAAKRRMERAPEGGMEQGRRDRGTEGQWVGKAEGQTV
jgi:hypothetical protein